MQVNFLLCGVQKAGTSAMDRYLRQHPELCLADRKEVHYFDDDPRFEQHTGDHDWYHGWFSPTQRHRMIGECTPIYVFWDHALERVRQYNPEMKLIVLLRNPIERAYAHWTMETARGQEDRSFLDAIDDELVRLKSAAPQSRVCSYLARGLYCKQLARMWSQFPEDQTLIIRHETLMDQPVVALSTVFGFLGVETVPVEPVVEHRSDYPRAMTQEERERLAEIFSDEIHGLEDLLGWDCKNWLDVPR